MFCLILIAPTMAKFALKFGTGVFHHRRLRPDHGGQPVGQEHGEGPHQRCFGFVIAMVGIAPWTLPPVHLWVTELQGGFALISVLTGSSPWRVMKNAKKSRDTTKVEVSSYKIKGFGFSMKEFITQCQLHPLRIIASAWASCRRGASTSNLIAYSVARIRLNTRKVRHRHYGRHRGQRVGQQRHRGGA